MSVVFGRGVEAILAILAFILCLPVMAMVALGVLTFLGWPVLFWQRRCGLGGRPFVMVKFRSMADRRDASGRLLPDNLRLGGFGRLLRRSRLDELPELLNVATGSLAFIGPRPLLPETIARYGDDGHRRCSVRPGLTGWAQVSGNSLLSDQDKLVLDLWYIEHRTIRLDLLIIWQTVRLLVGGERIVLNRIAAATKSGRKSNAISHGQSGIALHRSNADQ